MCVLKGEKLTESMCQVPNFQRLLCKSKFIAVEENVHPNFYGKNCIRCPNLLRSSSYLFKRLNKVFFSKKKINCESRNLFMS